MSSYLNGEIKGVNTATLLFGDIGAVNVGGEGWLFSGNAAAISLSEVYMRASKKGILRNLSVISREAPQAGHATTYTVQVNVIDTALTCTIQDAGKECEDLVHQIQVEKGDKIGIRVQSDSYDDESEMIAVTVDLI